MKKTQIIKLQSGKIQIIKSGHIDASLLCTFSYIIKDSNRLELIDTTGQRRTLFADDIINTQVLPAAAVDFNGDSEDLGDLLDNSFACNGASGDSRTIKANVILSGAFSGLPQTATVIFSTPFASNDYMVTVTGEDSRSWTIESKTATGFTINSNSKIALSGNTFFIATENGE